MNHQQQGNNVNGNGAGMNGMPMIAGQQMDVNFLFQKVLELSELLKENRERTQGIVAGAEELAVRDTTLNKTINAKSRFRHVQQRMEQLPQSQRPMPKSQVRFLASCIL